MTLALARVIRMMRALSVIVNNYQVVLYPLSIDMNIEGGLRWPRQSRKYFLVFLPKKCRFDYIKILTRLHAGMR